MIVWRRVGRRRYRSQCLRFAVWKEWSDTWWTAWAGRDAEASIGVEQRYFGDRARASAWCERRATEWACEKGGE